MSLPVMELIPPLYPRRGAVQGCVWIWPSSPWTPWRPGCRASRASTRRGASGGSMLGSHLLPLAPSRMVLPLLCQQGFSTFKNIWMHWASSWEFRCCFQWYFLATLHRTAPLLSVLQFNFWLFECSTWRRCCMGLQRWKSPSKWYINSRKRIRVKHILGFIPVV